MDTNDQSLLKEEEEDGGGGGGGGGADGGESNNNTKTSVELNKQLPNNITICDNNNSNEYYLQINGGGDSVPTHANNTQVKGYLDKHLKSPELSYHSGNSSSCRHKKHFRVSNSQRPSLHVQFHQDDGGHGGSDNSSSSMSSSSESSSEEESSLVQLSEIHAPDGGWGWVVVVASFFVNLIADGITFSFGIMFVEFLHYFGEAKSKTAWIGSMFMAMPLLSGPIASFLTDRFGCRKMSIFGAILAAIGFIISSMTNSVEVLFLTFGVLAGFGLSLCYVAAVVIVAYYFDRRRSLATGLSVCGSGIGTLVIAPLTQFLLQEYGWRGTTLILSGLFLNMCVCGCLMRDLPWTASKAKENRRERIRKRSQNRSGSSVKSLRTAASSADTVSCYNQQGECDETTGGISGGKQLDGADVRLSTSLVNLPTFVRSGEKVPLEVLELLSTHKNVYSCLLQNYPSLLISSRSCSDSGLLGGDQLSVKSAGTNNKQSSRLTARLLPNRHQQLPPSPLAVLTPPPIVTTPSSDGGDKRSRRLPTAYLKDLRVHRHSLTYRGAMLNINRYRLRASSCPDIYRNSMTTIAKEKHEWYSGLGEFYDLLFDMLDLSYFLDIRFLLFSLSNFLLYTWYDVPYVYLADSAIEMGFTEADASFLIAVIGICNMCGEVVLGWIGDREQIDALTVYACCMFLCGAVTSLVPLLSSYVSLCCAAGAFGLFIAANYSLTSIILVELITIERFTNAYGLLLLVQGVANLVGPPLAGYLYDVTSSYDLSFYLAGVFIILSGLMLFVLPCMDKLRTCRRPDVSEKNGHVKNNSRTMSHTNHV